MLNNFRKGIKLMYSSREMLWNFFVSDAQTTYAGSKFGALWILLGPLLFFGFYTLVYTVIFPFKPESLNKIQYILHVFCGISFFLAFSNGLSQGSGGLIANKNALLNTVFPAQLLPIKNIFIPIGSLMFSLVIMICVYIVSGKCTLYVLLVPFIVLAFITMLIGMVWIVSLLAIVFRDIQIMIGYITMFLLVVSPIAYTKEMIPSHLKFIIYANPLSYYIIPLQEALVEGKCPSLILMSMGIFLGVFLFGLGYRTFEESKKIVFDYV